MSTDENKNATTQEQQTHEDRELTTEEQLDLCEWFKSWEPNLCVKQEENGKWTSWIDGLEGIGWYFELTDREDEDVAREDMLSLIKECGEDHIKRGFDLLYNLDNVPDES